MDSYKLTYGYADFHIYNKIKNTAPMYGSPHTHTVVMQRVESQIITKVNGHATQQTLYYTVDPALEYNSITEFDIINSYRIFYIK
jgi:hypothetical protein